MKVKATKNRSIHIRIKQTEYDDIMKVAHREGITMAGVVRKAVRWYLYARGYEGTVNINN